MTPFAAYCARASGNPCASNNALTAPSGSNAPFQFPDGDRYTIHLSETLPGELRLSDRGHTLMHISYEHDVDSLLDGVLGSHLERIMGESGLRWDGGAVCLDTRVEHLPEAIFTFGQALTRVYDLTLHSTDAT